MNYGFPDLSARREALRNLKTVRSAGRVVQVVGLTIEAVGLDCQIGEVCEIHTGAPPHLIAEVVGFRNQRTLLMPLGEMQGVQPGSKIYPTHAFFSAPVGMTLLNRVLDGLGRPIDDQGSLGAVQRVSTYNDPPHPLQRKMIAEPLVTGLRAIDGLLTCGKGQRMGIFAGSGVGKSTLMGSIARNARADVNVIALIGERGRELQEFITRDLGPEGLRRSVVVVSTSDQPALVRLKAAWVATTIAEYFRNHGLDVIFMMDSVTRFAMAQREVGLAIGEPPASKGYTPSVFALLPRLLERTGAGERGTITGFYTVLVEGDDFNEPICDAVRSILDGHIILSRALAAQNHYPAIDVLNSISRVMPAITTSEERSFAGLTRRLLAAYEKARDLINIGAYVAGSDPEIDSALAVLPELTAFLQQEQDEACSYEATRAALQDIFLQDNV
ncbi:MAG TPA: flagellar protein export ATPase FliI [Anaerolineales bacterium]|nr:flagellar protein export ATPase FliI [Anaerolineales bacterium]